ncbi:hypothetical protein ASPWEDRAFT_73514, partial [Aspergillus wentii DTO 134E9]
PQQQQQQQPAESDGVWGKSGQRFSNKNASEYYDPCQEFATRSLQCMKRNAFDREMCGDYFQAYRDCKKEWVSRLCLSFSS